MTDNNDKPLAAKDDTEKLADLVKKTETWYNGWDEAIYRAREIITFLYVDQWDVEIRQARELLSKPTLQFNKLVPIIRSICGEQRDNTPSLAVRDITTNLEAPQQIIDALTDLIRETFYQSNSDIVFQIAFKQMIEVGWGSARVCIRYKDGDSFEQEAYLEPIVDFQAAFWDNTAQQYDKSDGDYCGCYTVVSKEKFKREHPEVDTESLTSAPNNYYLPWNDQDAIVIADIYVKEYFNKQIVQLSNNKVLSKKDADDFLKMQEDALLEDPMLLLEGYEPVEIVNQRTKKDYKIRHYQFVSNKLLDETDWPGKILPIPYAEGDSFVLDGRRMPCPYIQEAIDTQKMINYTGSEMAYAILRARKETIWATPSNVLGFEDQYANPDQVLGYMPYNPDDETQQPPIFRDPPVMSPMLLQTYQNNNQDLELTLGFNNEARGIQTNAISGSAIAKRQDASSKPVNVYVDNLSRLIKCIGMIFLDVWPNIIDEERSMVVRGADNQSRSVTFNQRNGFKMDEAGNYQDNIENEIGKYAYDLDVTVDGSMDEQKSAALDFFLRLAATNPAISNLIGDLVAENSGLEGAQKLKERLETLMPPDLLAKEKGLPPPPPPAPPPPDPSIVVAQIKAQTDLQGQQIQREKLANERTQMGLDAQLNQLDYASAHTKAQAEVIKAKASVHQAAINGLTAQVTAQSKLDTSIANAETKRMVLASQSKELRQSGI